MERRWPAWKVCYFGFFALIALAVIVTVIVFIVAKITDPYYPLF